MWRVVQLGGRPATGQLLVAPHSIEFDRIEQNAKDVFYSYAINGALHHILPQFGRNRADWLIEQIIEGWA